jgi:ribosome-binding protein aMBF1 (putative translation factor)
MGTFNYFNYFTEIEEYFWQKRGAHLLVSPLDWAIVETWQKAGIPLGTVLRGIDTAFESYQRSRRSAGRPLKSLAYCVDAVLDAATQEKETAVGQGPERKPAAGRAEVEPFSRDELRAFFSRNSERLTRAAERLALSDPELAQRVAHARTTLTDAAQLADSPAQLDLEDLERHLTVIEEKLSAALLAAASEEMLLMIRRDLDRQLAPYRRRMTADQLAQLERQYMQKRLFERFDVPRLSLFYLT